MAMAGAFATAPQSGLPWPRPSPLIEPDVQICRVDQPLLAFTPTDPDALTKKMPSSIEVYLAELRATLIGQVDERARAAEAKWGMGRLELLADPDLVTRFRQQAKIWNECVWDDTTAAETLKVVAMAATGVGRH